MSNVHGKDFKFYKQHAVSHVVEDIEEKGTTNNFNTRPGEGFFQEVEEAYEQTNKKNADVQVRILNQWSQLCWPTITHRFQMARIDENQEAIARIRMAIDNYDRARRHLDAEEDEIPDDEELHKSVMDERHWSLGAPEKKTIAKNLEQGFRQPSRFFRHFDRNLRSFLQKHITADCVGKDEPIKVCSDRLYHSYHKQITNVHTGTDIQMSLSSVSVTRKLDGGTRYLTM